MNKKEESKEEKKQKWYHKKQKHKHPNDDEQKQKQKEKEKEKEKQQSAVKSKSKISKTSTTTSTTATSDTSFKPSSEVKGLKFGGQFIVKSFTIRRAGSLELLRLLSLPPPTGDHQQQRSLRIFPSTVAFLPTNFTILAHHAWHTLTLGLGTNKSKVLITVFDSESLRSFFADRIWPQEIPLGEVNRRILRGLAGCELARFKFRKGCLTFYVYAVRREGAEGFERAADLRAVLEAVVALRDFLDHTAMLAMPSQRSINYATSCNNSTSNNTNSNSNSPAKQSASSAAKCSRSPPVAMAH